MFNAVRQIGGAIGVAVLTTAIVLAGHGARATTGAAGSLTPYRVAFLVAACLALLGAVVALSVRDADAANTMPGRRPRNAKGQPELSLAAD